MGDLYIIILVYGALLVDRSAKYTSLLFLVYVHEKFAHDHHVLSWIVRPFCVLLFIVFTLSCIVFSAYSRPLWAASYFDKDTERVIRVSWNFWVVPVLSKLMSKMGRSVWPTFWQQLSVCGGSWIPESGLSLLCLLWSELSGAVPTPKKKKKATEGRRFCFFLLFLVRNRPMSRKC